LGIFYEKGAMTKFSKILSHPDKNFIVRSLTQGKGVRSLAKEIKELHPNNKKLHISVPTLQAFRRDKLNLEGQALEAVKQAAKEKAVAKEEKKEDTQLRKIPAFREAAEKAASLHVDIRQELQELLATIKLRVEDLFDRAAAGTLTVNEEANLHKYFASWTTTIQNWAKYVDKIADHTIETNVNITIIEDQMAALRAAVRDTIEEEMDHDAATRFMHRLSQKINELSYRQQRQESFTEIKSETLAIAQTINDVEETDEG
jgi:hypothetical protein